MSGRQPITVRKENGLHTNVELDKSWEGYQQPVLMVTCSDGRIINARHGNKRNASILLELLSDDGERYVLYFNAVSNKKGFAVNHNSKFAKLYRLAVGANPINRYSKAQQLIKHFIGYEFHVQESELKHDDNGEMYHKIIRCSAADPISTIEWDKSGRLKPKAKKKSRLKPVPKLENNWKNNGSELEINWKTNGNELETQNSHIQHKHLVHSDNLPRNNLATYQRYNVQRTSIYTPVNKSINNKPVEGKPSVTYHSRNKGESDYDYFGRVIDATFFD
jgi:hypothetical protein